MDSLFRDVRLAFRTLTRSPGFALAAIGTLGLGISATTLVFSLVNGILLRPFPWDEPDRLVRVAEIDRDGNDELSYPDFIAYRNEMRTVGGLAGYLIETLTVRGAAAPERVEGARVSWNLFDVLGARPVLGRDFEPEEDVPNAERVVLIGYGLWQRAFGGRADVVGQVFRIQGDPHVVIGVMPPDFKFPRTAEAWLPLRRDPNADRGHRYLGVIGRLASGATVGQAQAEAEAVKARLDRDHSRRAADWSAQVTNLQEATVRTVRPVLQIMFAAVGFVLLIACANVANLLLSRASARDKEFAIRTALGAGRARLVRQLLTENMLLGLGGGVLGILLAAWWMDLILAAIPAALPYWLRIEIDGNVLLFTLVAALGTAFIFGLAPALQSTRGNLQNTLKEGRGPTASRAKNRLRSVLVVGQLTLAIVLLTGGLLMVRSFLAMRQVNPGFQVDDVNAVELNLPGLRYEAVESRLAFYERLLDRVRAIPGVDQAAAISYLPIGGASRTGNFSVEGRSLPEDAEHAHQTVVTPGYFRTMAIPLLRGRDFRDSDREGRERVAIINLRLAELYFGADDPVGKRIALGAGPDVDWMTIIGVSANVNQRTINQTSAEPEIYRPFAQTAGRGLSLVFRSARPLTALVPLIRREVQTLDPEIPVYNATTMKQVVANAVWDAKLNSALFGAFAAAAVILAAVGLYGVIAYSVSQRTQEIGLRVALGAEPRAVLRLVMGQGLTLVVVGLALGLAGAYAMAQLMSGLLFGVSGRDPFTFAVVPLLLFLVAILASYLPALRALRVDPMTALRLD